MDKPRDVRRGTSRFSTAKRHMNKQSGGHKFLGGFNAILGDLQFPEKSKKEKVRSLSAVGRALSSYQDCEMGCHVSEKAHGLPAQSLSSATKRFKIPKKVVNDCNRVDHASVPRKIRSAMKKRSRESLLLDSEKVNHKIIGIESPEKDGIKISKKQGSPDWSPRQAVSGPITKDEEEVVETLYALAGMFCDDGSNARNELDGKSLPEKSTILQNLQESANAAFEASGTAQEASPCPERLPREAGKINSINENIGQGQPDLSENAKFLVASHGTAPKISLHTTPMMVRSENGNKVALHDPELCLAMGLNMTRQSHISHIGRKPDMEVETVGGIACKQEQHMIKDQKQNEGPVLWPGLSTRASTGIKASYFQSSAAKSPNWLDAAISTSKQDLMEGYSSGGKISKVAIKQLSWKRCVAHVHISHLIQNLEVPKRQVTKEPELYECHQMGARGRSNCGVLMEVPNLNGMRNGVNSAPGTNHSATVGNSHETKNSILQQQCHYYDISQAPSTPGVYGPQKQGFNFLSLSARGNGLKANNNFNKVESRLERLSKLQVPYYQSVPQQHGLMSIPTPQSQYASTYLDQLPVSGPQVRLQQPPYYGSPLSGTHYSSTVSNKQQHQNFWAVQAASQGRSAVNCNMVRAQYHNWQNERHDSSAAVNPCAQAILPHSPASLGSKITSISEQQQQPIALASSSRGNGLRLSSSFCM